MNRTRIRTANRHRRLAGAGAAAVLASMLASPALAAPGPSGAVADPARAHDATAALTRRGHTRPALVSGVLTPRSTAAPEAITARFLASGSDVLAGVDPASLRLDAVTALDSGHVVRYRQTHQGLPVIGGAVVLRVDGQGRVRWAGSEAQPIGATLATTPALSARQALDIAGRAVGHDQAALAGLDPDASARLAVYTQPAMSEPRLAWWIELPFDPARRMTLRAFVDATTGHIYRLENRVVRMSATATSEPRCAPGAHRAHVYERNPVATPEPICVSLSHLLRPGATGLGNEDIATGNCVDNSGCRSLPGLPWAVHWCDDDATATVNGSGDFTHHVFESHTAADDAFAEVQMFYHATRAYEVARSLGGFTHLAARPLGAIVNFRAPIDLTSDDYLGDLLARVCTGSTYTGGEPLHAFDNAFFAPAGGFIGYPDRDSIVFGQGTAIDFAHDGDVVYHEFGHAVMNTVAPDLSFGFIDEHGFNPTPGGMHEGYADLMAMFVTNDSVVGEYAGQAFGQSAVRNIDNDHTCPESLIGETHLDSLPFTGAMWQARQAVTTNADERRAFDRAVFAAQQTLTESDDFQTAAQRTVLELELALGTDRAITVAGIFAERGIDGCRDRVVDGAAGKPLVIVGGNGQSLGAGVFPAPIQHRYDLPEGADAITLDIAGTAVFASGANGPPALSVGLKQGAPIRWRLDGGRLAADYTASELVAVDDGTTAATATLIGPFEPGTYYLQLFVDDGALILWDTLVRHHGEAPDTDPDTDPEDEPDADPSEDHPHDGDASGCGCVLGTSPGSQAGALVLMLLCLGLVVRVRRRR